MEDFRFFLLQPSASDLDKLKLIMHLLEDGLAPSINGRKCIAQWDMAYLADLYLFRFPQCD